MDKNIFKFDEYLNEDSYTISKDGMEKNDLEIYKDFYPEKWTYINFTDQKQEQILDTKYVWVIKYKNNIVSIFPDYIEEKDVRMIGDIIKKALS